MLIISLIVILMVLIGISMMSKISTATIGNRISAIAMVFAIAIAVFQLKNADGKLTLMGIALIIGIVSGLYMARKVKMIQMPETVALLNSFGGLASAIVAMYSYEIDLFSKITSKMAIAIGIITFVGSVVAAGKLAKIFDSKPKIYGYHSFNMGILLVMIILLIFTNFKGMTNLVLIILSALFGILFSIRVGGADMPIVISLLNSTSGVAASISGMTIFNPILISIGSIVGASGLILTNIMCKAMNRSLRNIILPKKIKISQDLAIENEELNIDRIVKENLENRDKKYEDLKKVIIVPGYGMALSQAQLKVKELMLTLENKGAEVKFAIHPVAGRMPGHMNVLLAEVDIDYEKFIEIDEANKEFPESDLVVIVGANDVVNPAANTAEGTPIYQMPILNVTEGKEIVVMNYDKKPGYAGVENLLYRIKKVRFIEGDAKESLDKFNEELKR